MVRKSTPLKPIDIKTIRKEILGDDYPQNLLVKYYPNKKKNSRKIYK